MGDGNETQWFDRAAGDPVELSESVLEWADLAREWSTRIAEAIRPVRARIEHVGSTAVPGLIAKPVVDLQVAVVDIEDEPSYRPGIETLGLVLRQREPDHRFFRPAAGQARTVHVHVCQEGSAWERDHLLFRDLLRNDHGLATGYAELKRRLAAEFLNDRVSYNRGKTEFIRTALASQSRSLS